MTPDVVADVGNTRIKWGRCAPDGVVEAVSLPPDDTAAWDRQAEAWHLPRPAAWAGASVHPARCARLAEWLRQRGDTVTVLTEAASLPLVVKVPNPDHVGIDRLLDAVAVNALREPDRPAVVIDAGSAVTVDWLNEAGAFVGGAILPGLGLMAKSLHEHTALLPLVEVPAQRPAVPGTATAPAIEAGIFWAVAGGVRALVAAYAEAFDASPQLFLTGGDAPALRSTLLAAHYSPFLTLDGIRLSVRGE